MLVQLKSIFPILENIPEILFKTSSYTNQSVIIGSDGSIILYVNSENVKPLFDHFNVQVPALLNDFLLHTTNIRLDLNSITSGSIKFYISFESIFDNYIQNLYKFDSTLASYTSIVNPILTTLGFVIDSNSSVVSFNYFWQSKEVSETLYNFSFNTDGFINLIIQQGEINISPNRLLEVFPSLSNLNITGYQINYVNVNEISYIAIMKKLIIPIISEPLSPPPLPLLI